MSDNSDIYPRILTNMAFWQSTLWVKHTTSIYAMDKHAMDTRTLSCGREAWALLRNQHAYDVVVTMGSRTSLLYGLLCALSHLPSKQILCEFFLDNPKPKNPAWQLKTMLYRLVSKRAIGILTNSSAEVSITAARLNVSKEKIRYVPMHTNIETPAMSSTDEGFILSAGRTLRDYAVLLKVAPQLNMPIHIICGANDILIHPLPKNITIHKDIAYDDYLDYLKRCSFMVLPLLPTMRSTGQVVMFEAMAFGKPVIASESPGTVDYIEHDRNGLLIEGSNAIDLAAACNRLIHDIRLRQHLGQQSLQSILGKHLIETHARHKLHAIHELLSALQFNSILAQRR